MLLLKDILGQEKAITQLRQANAAGRLPHGLIFSGPSGVGKGTTARALAALFLCDNPGAEDACGKCHSCHLLDVGTHPDYHLVYRQLVRLDSRKPRGSAATGWMALAPLAAEAGGGAIPGGPAP